MDSDHQYWIRFWQTMIAAFVVTVIVTQYYYIRTNAMVAEMVSKGADPIAAACALGQYSSQTALCLLNQREESQ